MDTLSPGRRSENMRAIKSKDMAPELAVRLLVHRMGYRYRLHQKNLPGRPDLVFAWRKKVVFVHGCFWHQHQDLKCKITRVPKSNQAYWLPKFERNRNRDLETQAKLKELGWKALVVWECQVEATQKLAARLRGFLSGNHPLNQSRRN